MTRLGNTSGALLNGCLLCIDGFADSCTRPSSHALLFAVDLNKRG